MTKWRTFDFYCPKCEITHTGLLLDLDNESVSEQTCFVCDSPLELLFSAPAILRASYPDGTVRDDVRAEREASKLLTKSYDLPPEKRGDLTREAAKIRRSVKKKTGGVIKGGSGK